MLRSDSAKGSLRVSMTEVGYPGTRRIGGAFTPGLLHPEFERRLSLFGDRPFVEFGFGEWRRWESLADAPDIPDFSLHLGRTAICEDQGSQDTFVGHVVDEAATRESSPVSIGVHVTGDRAVGGGSFGLHSHFTGTREEERRAIRFLDRLGGATELPVWIENANCYSATAGGTLGAWRSVTRICEATGTGLIVDLAHLYIDAVNCGVPQEILLGAVPWDSVVEVHLSGVRTGRDGTLHDGHSEPVHEGVWSLLETVVAQRLLPEEREVNIIVEHADARWTDQPDQYYADFARATAFSESVSAPGAGSAHDYGAAHCRGYLRQLCRVWIPKLAEASEQRGLPYADLFDQWVEDVRARDKRIVLSLEEVPKRERDGVVVAKFDLLSFAKKRLATC